MRIKPTIHFISAIILIWVNSEVPISCNPLAYDPTSAPLIALPPVPLQAPMLMGPQFDPYASMQTPQYILTSPFGPMSFDSNRRSLPGIFRSSERNSNKPPVDSNSNESDEQKALNDLPVSFIDPEEPSSITERISDSFSAIGEGVRNHFRSLTENFSDTMDDIKDAWRPSDNSKKRG